MPQSLILFKKLPYEDYLKDLHRREVYRAAMSFLPGGCYAGAALYDASPEYSTRSATIAPVAPPCPYPDEVNCLIWEAMQGVRKVSPAKPLDFNAFLFLELESGAGEEFVRLVLEVGGPDDGSTDYVVGERGREYVASAHLIGSGPYNAVVEVLAEDHDRLLEILHRLTDVAFVKQYCVGRLAAHGAYGFGEDNAAGAAGASR